MDCREFSVLTKAFIYDELNDNKLEQSYLAHAKECPDCADDLEVIYSMHRALGDIMGPDGTDDSSDYTNELQIIYAYLEEKAKKERTEKRIRGIVALSLIIIAISVVAATLLTIC